MRVPPGLSDPDREIARLAMRGKSTKEIATALGRTPDSIKHRLRVIGISLRETRRHRTEGTIENRWDQIMPSMRRVLREEVRAIIATTGGDL